MNALDRQLRIITSDGFGLALTPAGFTPFRRGRTWIREANEIQHLVSLEKSPSGYQVQWGLMCREVVPLLWGFAAARPHVGHSIVTGHSTGPCKAARVPWFSSAELQSSAPQIAEKLREDLVELAGWLDEFQTRADVRAYLLQNRDATDRREFLIPAKLALKLLTAAALALADESPDACQLVADAVHELRSFGGEITAGRLARLRLAASTLCGDDILS
jgi:hypothetical protein